MWGQTSPSCHGSGARCPPLRRSTGPRGLEGSAERLQMAGAGGGSGGWDNGGIVWWRRSARLGTTQRGSAQHPTPAAGHRWGWEGARWRTPCPHG